MKSRKLEISIPRIGEGKRGVEGYSAYLLRQAAGAMRSALDRVLEPAGMTNAQFSVLAMLSMFPGASGADLARLSQLTPQTITVITRNLAAARLIHRGSALKGHRQIPYELSEQGHKILANGKRILADMEADLLRGFSAAETLLIKRWLVEVAKRLHSPKD